MILLNARRARQGLGSLAALATLLGFSAAALAQSGFGGGRGGMGGPGGPGGFAPPGGTSKKKAPAKKPEDETHAASNVEAVQSLQTQEPQLPQNPLEVPADVKARIGTDASHDVEVGRAPTTERKFYGPYYEETSGKYRFRTIPPLLWGERTMPDDRASIYGFYYNRRGKNHDADVAFPFYWHLRDYETTTTAVFPFIHRERAATPDAPARHDNWLVPLAFEGGSADGTGYFHVPPLLAYSEHTAKSGLNIVGPMFCKWKGGPACDPRTADSMDMGLAPLYFYGKTETSEYEAIPPLLHYYRYDEVGDKSTNLWGPVLLQHSPDKEVVDVLPLFYRSWGKNESHTTLFPFFHYGYKGNSSLLVTPLFLSAKGEDGSTNGRQLGLRQVPRADRARHVHALLLGVPRSGHRARSQDALALSITRAPRRAAKTRSCSPSMPASSARASAIRSGSRRSSATWARSTGGRPTSSPSSGSVARTRRPTPSWRPSSGTSPRRTRASPSRRPCSSASPTTSR